MFPPDKGVPLTQQIQIQILKEWKVALNCRILFFTKLHVPRYTQIPKFGSIFSRSTAHPREFEASTLRNRYWDDASLTHTGYR